MIAAIHGILEQGQGWNPTQLSGLVHYMNADKGVAKDGSNGVDSWTDQALNSVWANYTSGGLKPLFVPSDPNYSGKASIQFTPNTATPANTTRLKRPAYYNIGTEYTIFELSYSTVNSFTLAGNSHAEGGYWVVSNPTDSYAAAGGAIASWPGLGGSHYLNATRIRHIRRSGLNIGYWVDNDPKGVKVFNNNFAFSFLCISGFLSGADGLNGTIRMQIAYNRALSDEEVSLVYNFLLANK